MTCLIDSYRVNGVDVVIDAYPYARASTSLGVTLPRWAVAGRQADIAARIEDAQTRARIVAGMKAMLDSGGYTDYSFAAVAQYKPNPELNGMTISEINESAGREPTIDNEIDTILQMMIATIAVAVITALCQWFSPNLIAGVFGVITLISLMAIMSLGRNRPGLQIAWLVLGLIYVVIAVVAATQI